MCNYDITELCYVYRNRQVSKIQSQVKKGNRDAAQERMRAMHKKRIEQRTQEMKAREQEQEHDKINPNMIIDRFDENRGRLILEFFISHFITLAKKSNEFSSFGQSLLYVKHADNLMKLMQEMGYYGANNHMGFQTELEQLKQVIESKPFQRFVISHYCTINTLLSVKMC